MLVTKRRLAREVHTFDFSKALLANEVPVSATLSMIVASTGADVTDQFRSGEPAPAITGNVVTVWLRRALVASEQLPLIYLVSLRVTTSIGQDLYAVDDEGFPRLVVRG